MTAKDIEFVTAVPVIPADDTAKAIAFYRDQLGFTLAFEQGEYAGVTRGPIELHLDGASGDVTGSVSCRIHVRDVDGLHTSIDSRGVVDPAEPLETKPWGTRQFSVRDPSGNRITFVEAP